MTASGLIRVLIPRLMPVCCCFSDLRLYRGRSLSVMAASGPSRMFQLKVNQLTGVSEWVVIDDDETRWDESSNRFLLSSSMYLDMLNDTRRNKAFYEAIRKTINKPCHVLDIGAGTGLLSMMAVKAMESSDSLKLLGAQGMVSACESYLPMVKLMREVVRHNGMESKIRICHKRSDELKVGIDLPSRADILVSEILDSELLGEGLIPTLQHAHDHLLVKNALTVPYKATTSAQLVEWNLLPKHPDLCSWEAHVSDDIRLIPSWPTEGVGLKSKQHAIHCNEIAEQIKLLSKPFRVFEFDFWKRPESHGEKTLNIDVTDGGTVHAVISWWVLQLDHGGDVFYSTAPKWVNLPTSTSEGNPGWCDHWKQCVWFIPGGGLPVAKGDMVFLQAAHDEASISYAVNKGENQKDCSGYNCPGNIHIALTPERIGVYGDKQWRMAMLTALKIALAGKNSPLCMVADDSIFLTILTASLSKMSHVLSLFSGIRDKGLWHLQVVAASNGYDMNQVTVLGRRETTVTLSDTDNRKVDLLLGEPFYYGKEAMLPWQNLRFWQQRTLLASLLSDDVTIMPCKGILKGCAMSLPDLWRSRRCLNFVEGFEHSVVNGALGACGNHYEPSENPCLSYFTWQCGETKVLSEEFTIMTFDFRELIKTCYGRSQVRCTHSGVCHGLVLWIDWVMDSAETVIIPTGLDCRWWRKGVKLLRKPVTVEPQENSTGKSCSFEIEAIFNSDDGELMVKCII